MTADKDKARTEALAAVERETKNYASLVVTLDPTYTAGAVKKAVHDEWYTSLKQRHSTMSASELKSKAAWIERECQALAKNRVIPTWVKGRKSR